jgi:hypothetical protein
LFLISPLDATWVSTGIRMGPRALWMVKYSCWLCHAGLGKAGSGAGYGKGHAWQLWLKDDNGPGMQTGNGNFRPGTGRASSEPTNSIGALSKSGFLGRVGINSLTLDHGNIPRRGR